MVMDIIPAIDLKNGKCVRLLQGRDEATTEYSSDPVAVAKRWRELGATRLHVVNLDGAFGRASDNIEIVRCICEGVDASVQFGGGLRSMEDMDRAIAVGVKKLVLGTIAIENKSLLSDSIRRIGTERIIVALDASHGKVATRGWKEITDRSVLDLAKELEEMGVEEILFTDISRDGMMNGPDLDTLKMLAETTTLRIIASGGVSDREDILALAQSGLEGITGVIIGKALYEGKIDLRQILKEVRSC
jgi:phosphoribosylformimino-5-aminoimidazole carboxamide ribotide isomerase